MAITKRRLPPPWSVEEQRLFAYVYFEDEAERRSAAKLLSKDEARRIAINIAKLPDLLLEAPAALDCHTPPSSEH